MKITSEIETIRRSEVINMKILYYDSFCGISGDMNLAAFYGYIEEKLFEVGALDVFKTPILMKKGRPGIELSVLTNEKVEKNVLDVIFEETTS